MSKTRINILCPVSLSDIGNHLGGALGSGFPDMHTYDGANVEAGGVAYSMRQVAVSAAWFSGAQLTLTQPGWDSEGLVDLAKATQAQGLLTVWDGTGAPPAADPARIVVLPGLTWAQAMAALGVTWIEGDV